MCRKRRGAVVSVRTPHSLRPPPPRPELLGAFGRRVVQGAAAIVDVAARVLLEVEDRLQDVLDVDEIRRRQATDDGTRIPWSEARKRLYD